MNHVHSLQCLEHDIEDLSSASGDDGSFEYWTCQVTGETHKNLTEFGL